MFTKSKKLCWLPQLPVFHFLLHLFVSIPVTILSTFLVANYFIRPQQPILKRTDVNIFKVLLLYQQHTHTSKELWEFTLISYRSGTWLHTNDFLGKEFPGPLSAFSHSYTPEACSLCIILLSIMITISCHLETD